MCLNYSESTPTLPTLSMENLSSMKLVLGARKVGECCIKMPDVDMRHLRYLRPDIKSLKGDGVRTFGPFSWSHWYFIFSSESLNEVTGFLIEIYVERECYILWLYATSLLLIQLYLACKHRKFLWRVGPHSFFTTRLNSSDVASGLLLAQWGLVVQRKSSKSETWCTEWMNV